MNYVKFTCKYEPSIWSIWAHKKGSDIYTMVLSSTGDNNSYTGLLHVNSYQITHDIIYLTQREFDMLILELL